MKNFENRILDGRGILFGQICQFHHFQTNPFDLRWCLEARMRHCIVLPLGSEIKPPADPTPTPKPAVSKFKFLQKGREICTTCQTTVYAAEKTLGPKNKIYHKMCLRCLSCNKALASGSFVDHDSEPFCKGCYAKYFGPRGIGFGTLSFAQ